MDISTKPSIVLASGSPRRRELLRYLGLAFQSVANDAEEQEHPAPPEVVAALPPVGEAPPLQLGDHPTLRAWRKADAACAELPDSVIIGADTIVVLDGAVLNKPLDAAHARAMLASLSGRTHRVYTGLCLLAPANGVGRATGDERAASGAGPRQRSVVSGQWSAVVGRWSVLLDLVASDVTIDRLTEDEIDAYVATGEPLDKAGSYGIQGLGGRLVRSVSGSYTNVVGLPLVALHRLLEAAGITGMTDPTAGYRRWLSAQGKEPLPCPPTFP
jgi:septum formation protein